MSDDQPDPALASARSVEPVTPVPKVTTVTAGRPLLLKLDAVAAELQCTRRSLERQIAAGRITALHIGRSVRIERRELEAFVDLLREEARSHTSRGADAPRVVGWTDPHNDRGGVHGQTA